MQELEARFGTPHPELVGFKEPPPALRWMVDAFFRLHKRRQLAEMGFQPLSTTEIAQFADLVLRLKGEVRDLFIRVMEETDNAVMFDNYERVSSDVEQIKNGKPGKRGRKKL